MTMAFLNMHYKTLRFTMSVMSCFLRVVSAALFVLFASTSTSFAQVVINEVMSSNTTLMADADGDFSDWIELYNKGDESINLEGYFLSDKESNPYMWALPAVEIPAHSFLFIWASGKEDVDSSEELHANFKISASGESIFLSNEFGENVDVVHLPILQSNTSYARFPDGSGDWKVTGTSTPNSSNVYTFNFTEVEFSHLGGFYTNPINLELTYPDEDVIILYTIDGSEPHSDHLDGTEFRYRKAYRELPIYPQSSFLTNSIWTKEYQSSIYIKDRTSERLDGASVPVTYDYVPTYFPERTQDVFKGTVIKARAYKEGEGYGPVSTHTYFVDRQGRNRYKFPVVSLSTSKISLFDHNEGLHLPGSDFDKWRNENLLLAAHPKAEANYNRTGKEWEYLLQMEYFDQNENQAEVNQSLGFRMHGGWSRALPQKSFRLYARDEYGKSRINFPFFENVEQEKFKRIFLRRLSDFSMADAMYLDLVGHLNFDVQAAQPAVVFLNGEYWGLMDIRERFGKHYLQDKYGVDKENLDYIAKTDDVKEGDFTAYSNMHSFVSKNSLVDDENYNYIANQIDLDNYIDYHATEVYAANRDWPHNNINFWRLRTDSIIENAPYGHDGKWRWLMLDMDLTMDASRSDEAHEHETLAYLTRRHTSTALFRGLIENKSFQNKFLNRFSDLLNTTFLPQRMEPIITQRKRTLEPFFPELLKRWLGKKSIRSFANHFNRMYDFIELRPAVVREHLQDYFQINSQVNILLDVNKKNPDNYIKINTIDIHERTVGVHRNPYPWQGIYFSDIPIELTAVAAPNYEFSHWGGGLLDSSATITISLDADMELTAYFNLVDTSYYTLEYTSSEGGYLEGDTVQVLLDGESSSPVFAQALSGYRFSKWSDGVKDNPRVEVGASKNINVTAEFELITHVSEKSNILKTIYPNPTQDKLIVQLGEDFSGRAYYSIYTIHGQEVQSGVVEQSLSSIDVQPLPSSIYLLRIDMGDKGLTTAKFMKH